MQKQPFAVGGGGGVKILRTRGGLRNFRTGGRLPIWGGIFAGGRSVGTPLHGILKLYMDEDISMETGMGSQILISIIFCACT